jgi:hypothetical protein
MANNSKITGTGTPWSIDTVIGTFEKMHGFEPVTRSTGNYNTSPLLNETAYAAIWFSDCLVYNRVNQIVLVSTCLLYRVRG